MKTAAPSSFKENVPLSTLCTIGIGGPARYVCEVRSAQDLSQALHFCAANSIPHLILGKGSNCLFADEGFNGVVIINKIDFYENHAPGLFHVGAGYSFSLLGVQTARQGWAGLEFASGIPASVGGAVYMNAGANGAETCETLVSVDYVYPDGSCATLPKDALRFAYRSSSFQTMKGAITGATFQLATSSEARQKQLEIINYRIKTQPYNAKSAGCFFRNPRCGHAGALIDRCGLKGMQIGGAKVSEMHANFIINTGEATAKDVRTLLELIQQTVKSQTGLCLEIEVKLLPLDQVQP